MSNENKKESDLVLDLQFSNDVLKEYVQLHEEMVKNLSVSHLDQFAEILKSENKAFNQDKVLENFRNGFLKQITKSLVKSWETSNIAVNLSTLQLLKAKFQNNRKPGWRPHGKTFEELQIPNRIKILSAEKKFLEKHLSWQKNKLEEEFTRNQKFRNEIVEVRKQREYLEEQILYLTEQMPQVKKQLIDLTERVVNMDLENLKSDC